ncbi:MAG: hypothetical protein J2P27_07150 [Actinobacteria bacterium]|nr:hypothetical protein [Actinomycetota bacterium]
MQYFVNRTSDGRLGLGLIIVREIANQRRAVTQVPYPPHTEMIYLLGAEQDATRLELTARWRDAAKAPESQIMGRAVPDFVRSAVDSYKSILEETERAPQGPLSDQENP